MADDEAASGTSVRWGALSAGRIVSTMIEAASQAARARFVAVASRSGERARACARRHGLERWYGSYDELLADPSIDVVYVGLPNSLHVEWTIRALAAGKHVLCEKPLGASERDVAAAFDAADRAGRLLAEAFLYRHHPQTARVRELVAGGAIGALATITAAMSFTIEDPAADPRNRPELDGGALLDLGCYAVSAARLLAGEPRSATGQQVRGDSGVDRRFAGMLRFPGDVIAQFDVGMDLPRRDRLEIVGTAGSIVLGDPWHCRTPYFELHRDGGVELISTPAADAYAVQLEAFSRAVLERSELPFGAADALAQARVLERLRRSA
jgi:xylose dehydrogenase (NAD/NADP)